MNQDLMESILPDDIELEQNVNNEIEVDSFLDEFFVAKMRVVQLEKENAELKYKMESLQRWKDEIERVMLNETMNNNQPQKEKKQRQKSNEQESFHNFCQEHKKDDTILSRVSAKITSLGYDNVKRVPWSVLKLELRSMFDALTEEGKIKYLHKTRN